LNSHAEINRIPPAISQVNYYSSGGLWSPPSAGESIWVNATVTSPSGINRATLYYATGIYGRFEQTPMFDDGMHNDLAAGDGLYGAELPGQSSGQWVRFYVEAAAADAAQTVSYAPPGAEHDVYIFQVVPSYASSKPVTINEVMASNTMTAADPAGEYDDWIELHNLTGTDQDIGGYFLTDNELNLIKWEIPPGTMIPANGYLIVWADEDGSQGDLHANFKLSASGEQLYLFNPNLEIVDEVLFGIQTTDMGFARVPNGTGPFVIQAPTFQGNNDLGTGITEAVQPGISIYPNPASDQVIIFAGDKNTQLNIFDSMGRLMSSLGNSNSYVLDVSSWPSGMYMIQSDELNRKMVVKH
jgi:hypothetical protein